MLAAFALQRLMLGGIVIAVEDRSAAIKVGIMFQISLRLQIHIVLFIDICNELCQKYVCVNVFNVANQRRT